MAKTFTKSETFDEIITGELSAKFLLLKKKDVYKLNILCVLTAQISTKMTIMGHFCYLQLKIYYPTEIASINASNCAAVKLS